MKKSILALAVLGAFTGAVSAQSSVTLYGRLDNALVWTDPGSDRGDSRYSLNGHDVIGGSRWGLRGSEDLGGGLKANFVIESGFNGDTGAQSGSKLFDRQAFVSLSSKSLGEVRLGRQQTLTREVNLLTGDISSEGELTITESVASNRPLFQNFSSRVDNAVQYLSPSFGGFQVRGLVAAGEGVTARQQGLMVSYSAGPLKAALSYETYANKPARADDPDTTPANEFNADKSGSYNEVATVGASYNFGVATLLGSYQNTTDLGSSTAFTEGTDHDAYNVGVMVPFGAFQFRAQYTTSTVETANGDLDQDKYGASLRYSLSKRTQLYTVVTKREGDNDETFTRDTQVAFGIGHNF
ncbi:MAG: porin [Methylibium sp.]|uniref:porin n=1 Tax=Methylibium sp. TaxID=2067992 RepID=UPI0018006D1D|nr:porin [Methylibium sp.]MBA3598883.1 porin [Methylibium sp.]